MVKAIDVYWVSTIAFARRVACNQILAFSQHLLNAVQRVLSVRVRETNF